MVHTVLFLWETIGPKHHHLTLNKLILGTIILLFDLLVF